MKLVERRDLGFLAYWAVTKVMRRFSPGFRLKTALPVAHACARLWLWLSPAESPRTLHNLRLILGDQAHDRDLVQLDRVHHQEHVLAFLLPDILPKLSQEQIRGMSEVRGLEHLEAARAQGRGAVLLSAHVMTHGYLLVGSLAAHGVPVTAIAGEEATPVGADEPDRSWAYRKLVHPLRNYPRSFVPFLTKGLVMDPRVPAILHRNDVIWVQGDMHLSEDEAAKEHFVVSVPFLWGTAVLRTGPVRMAKVFKAPILPCFGYRDGMRFVIEIEPPLALRPGNSCEDLQADLRAFLERLGLRIRARPHQWAFTRHEILPHWIRSEPARAQAQTAPMLPARVP